MACNGVLVRSPPDPPFFWFVGFLVSFVAAPRGGADLCRDDVLPQLYAQSVYGCLSPLCVPSTGRGRLAQRPRSTQHAVPAAWRPSVDPTQVPRHRAGPMHVQHDGGVPPAGVATPPTACPGCGWRAGHTSDGREPCRVRVVAQRHTSHQRAGCAWAWPPLCRGAAGACDDARGSRPAAACERHLHTEASAGTPPSDAPRAPVQGAAG